MLFPVILAGGSGTRLWPLSRQFYPKQLMPLTGSDTMIQATVRRLAGVPDMGRPIVLCNEIHRFMVAEQMRKIEAAPDRIILEPFGRNTAPAVAVAALAALERDGDPTLLVMPSDHYIEDGRFADGYSFSEALTVGRFFADLGALIAFGVVPAAPETGYGYIRKGSPPEISGGVPLEFAKAARIDAFVEKPDRQTAEDYLRTGRYFWNSGMFMFKAAAMLSELERFAPDIVHHCREAVVKGRVDLDFFRLDEKMFEACPSDSIDYAVMEKTDRGVMVPLAARWNDLGSWEALWGVGDKDGDRNVIEGDVVTRDVTNCYLRSTSRMLAAVGIDNHIIVETADAVLISPRDRAQDVKAIVDQLKQGSRREALNHKTGYRPWGTCEQLVISGRFHVNRLTVRRGEKLSLQRHRHRAEHWVVLSGRALVRKGDQVLELTANASVDIPPGVVHRLENIGDGVLDVIEVQTGEVLGETDIERLEDVYGRSMS
ncbi:MAG: mannose-1-phosphate guanylyltransferase/mannose-6-phosphate isomerase [Thermodesulfobacteriota bacterium]